MSLKCANFDVNRNIFEDLILCNDSFVPQNIFPVQFDSIAHATSFISGYPTHEYSKFFEHNKSIWQ